MRENFNVGSQILLELYGVEDADFRRILESALSSVGVRVVKYFKDSSDTYERAGALLFDSHAFMYYFRAEGKLLIDVFTCSLDGEKHREYLSSIEEELLKRLDYKSLRRMFLQRG